MNTVEKINIILKEANISKVNLAKYLGVSRQMVYNYLDGEDLSKLSNDKSQALFSLLNVKNEEELKNIELTKEYIQDVGNKLFNSKKNTVKKNEIIELTGQVALFEICFEQSWKAMKEILEYNGYDESRTGSPRSILKLAYQAGMIEDEELWVEALASRNNVSHAYNEGIAVRIVSETKAKYIDMFEVLEKKIKSDWISE